ncbi:MAG: Possible arabinofuranosyltransferase AftB [uncultured Acidimicrobiales bacterium]|uniref:Possible arabinofuranosyltransferase AftB n=1 Tax=uncultured Acidimicrobiales bacterium TaxID=310071 RepID=A0A6J4IW12_9ACTN|nr:MAG: Possible arabinofuranosyltransferase AftB [uncultured Acidimicrobiales bacterium]
MEAGVGRRTGGLVMVAVPVAVLLVGAWSRRWLADDGFINLRIVEQVWAGNGPVWNATERVETGTSPLWLALLVVAGGVLRSVPLEWVAVALGMAASAVGLAAASMAARTLHAEQGARLVPVGALVVAAIPAFWDFSSSGLETGLSFLWLGTSGWALAVAAGQLRTGMRRPLATAALLGLGPLVRPDLALVALPLLIALLVAIRPLSRRELAGVVVAAGAAPVAFQVFRMAYYASLVPNTALAKEGAQSNWTAGWSYASDHVGTWRLWWPAAVLVVVAVALATGTPTRRRGARQVVTVAIVGGALVHALYVVRVGGDFMHARLLLPATFAVVLPWAVVPARRVTLAAAVALVPWALLAATTWQPTGQPGNGPADGVVDERAYYANLAGHPHPITAEDFGGVPYAVGGRRAAASATEGRGHLTFRVADPADRTGWIAAADASAPFAVAVDNVGVFGYLAGPEVSVIDVRGLGDPVASRLRLVGPRGRPGHEKRAEPAWVLARYAAPDASPPTDVVAAPAEVAAARAALACGDLGDILEGITRPLTPARARSNLGLGLTTSDLRTAADPVAARRELCGG